METEIEIRWKMGVNYYPFKSRSTREDQSSKSGLYIAVIST